MMIRHLTILTLVLAFAAPARAQIGSVLKRAQQFRDIQMTDQEEAELGSAVSEKIRARYGVAQDAEVHKYVALVGTVLALEGKRPKLPYQFIVLDTDGVNAFAAPGGFIHITRGALALINDEAELAGVLSHELIHVTEKHTIRAIQKGKLVQAGASETMAKDSPLFAKMVEKTTDLVMAGFGRGDELESDEKGIALASKVGYDPAGLERFLTRLAERNKASTEKQGLFASHPEMKERMEKLQKEAAKLTSTATLADRYKRIITYKPVPLSGISPVEAGAAGLAGSGSGTSKDAGAKDEGKKEAEPKEKKGFGLGRLMKPMGGDGKKSAEVTGSGAGRGVDTERNAQGGSNPKVVAVNITPADLEKFKKEGGLK